VLTNYVIGISIGVLLSSIFLTWLTIKIYSKFLSRGDDAKVVSIKIAEPIYIPTYIGYFLISISIIDIKLGILILIIIIFLLYKTKQFYFNIFLFVLGYNFYEIETENGCSITVISKKANIKRSKSFNNLVRLNEFVFLDTQK
jgi:hypothetical protein